MTQNEKVLKHIQTKGYITSLDAVKYLNIIDLQSNVRDLRNKGINVKGEWVTNRKTKSTYKVYSLKQKNIDKYKEVYA